MALIDITGQTFNYLTVIERVQKPEGIKNRSAYWKCKCKCGNETIVMGTNLRNGTVKSCGCLQKKEAGYTDITGQKFGHLTVLEDDGTRDKQRTVMWKCQCDCENQTIVHVRKYDLIRGKTKSCGCHRSQGEDQIANILTQNNIPFQMQYSPNDFAFNNEKQTKCYFDFFVDEKYIIEFDGEQHFHGGGSGWFNEDIYQKTKQRDYEKNQYCFNHNIPIIRIPYTHLNKITLEDLKIETSNFLLRKENNNEE